MSESIAADVLQALSLAREFLGRQPELPKGTAFEWICNWPCLCIVAAITTTSPTSRIRDGALDATRLALPRRFGRIEDYNDQATISEARELLQRAKDHVRAVMVA
ncbi:hypothetical protein DSM43518_02062 [Mycobacterium marinum]|uniref:hypothetical protein n=1 Tax=Mycobacterium marinum TaxID=1781 RepID=UPI000CD94F79|nr:hypothetical protein [Mycobacterium marinum]AXN50982.1 hypothetical protein CCUG20998_03580 [Mycobacterium marinum]RFZ11222.1 hypothetical protein DSM43518_02062 [Mycobacterium marinum]RFZ25421.1 hypothetical protein DSM43519_01607 [Mycobacterium marinum]RFZ28306.1 hypothetical protein DSM44344_01351 [Mycobacterium marinum]RFZ33866.1 hypothetical protein NCTC2275_02712 [Mycobacterium marinum]